MRMEGKGRLEGRLEFGLRLHSLEFTLTLPQPNIITVDLKTYSIETTEGTHKR